MALPIKITSGYANSIVRVYSMEYNTTVMRDVLSATPRVSGIYCSIVKTDLSKERQGAGIADKDRSNAYRFQCEESAQLEDILTPGDIVEVTHTKTRYGNYVAIPTGTRYVVSTIEKVTPTSSILTGELRKYEK